MKNYFGRLIANRIMRATIIFMGGLFVVSEGLLFASHEEPAATLNEVHGQVARLDEESNTAESQDSSNYLYTYGAPIVQELYTPTNADKKIYGRVVVPTDNQGNVRPAQQDEVWVKVQVKQSAQEERVIFEEWVPTLGAATSVYGEPAQKGIFMAELDTFLQTGNVVSVVDAQIGGAGTLDGELEEEAIQELVIAPVTEEISGNWSQEEMINSLPPEERFIKVSQYIGGGFVSGDTNFDWDNIVSLRWNPTITKYANYNEETIGGVVFESITYTSVGIHQGRVVDVVATTNRTIRQSHWDYGDSGDIRFDSFRRNEAFPRSEMKLTAVYSDTKEPVDALIAFDLSTGPGYRALLEISEENVFRIYYHELNDTGTNYFAGWFRMGPGYSMGHHRSVIMKNGGPMYLRAYSVNNNVPHVALVALGNYWNESPIWPVLPEAPTTVQVNYVDVDTGAVLMAESLEAKIGIATEVPGARPTGAFSTKYPWHSYVGWSTQHTMPVDLDNPNSSGGAYNEWMQTFTPGDYDPNLYLYYEGPPAPEIQSKAVIAEDVTPPTSLTVDQEQVTNTTKQLSGTIDLFCEHDQQLQPAVYIFAKTARGYLTGADGNHYWQITEKDSSVAGSATKKHWLIDLPAYLDPDLDQYIEFYAKDELDTIDASIDKAFTGAPPDTFTKEPNGRVGNHSPSFIGYENYPGYRDAVGQDRFTAAVYFDIRDVTPSAPKIEMSIPNYPVRTDSDTPAYEIPAGNRFTYAIDLISGDSVNAKKDAVETIQIRLDRPSGITISDIASIESQTAVSHVETSGSRLIIHLKDSLPPGGSQQVLVPAMLNDSAKGKRMTTNVLADGESSVEDPFVIGPPSPSNAKKRLQAETSVEIIAEERASIGDQVYLSVVNNQLRIFYSNVDLLSVYIDGTFFAEIPVTKKNVTESIDISYPIDEIRNHVAVRYRQEDKEEDAVAYWNNTWSFMD